MLKVKCKGKVGNQFEGEKFSFILFAKNKWECVQWVPPQRSNCQLITQAKRPCSFNFYIVGLIYFLFFSLLSTCKWERKGERERERS